MIINKLYFTVLVLLTMLFSPVTGRAFEIINDNFMSLDNTNWSYQYNGGEILYNGSFVYLGSTGPEFPLMRRYSTGKIFSNDNDSYLELKYKFNQVGPSGSGIGIGFTGINGRPFYLFGLWADGSGINLLKNDYSIPLYGNCTNFSDQPFHSSLQTISLPNDLEWHILSIELVDSVVEKQYKVFLDKDINLEPILVSNYGNCNPENIWFGNPLSVYNTWSKFSVDYLKTNEIVSETKHKLIFIPGLGGSWNTRAMVYNSVVGDNEWYMTPFIRNYDSFLKGLENNGMVKNTDYFVWNYDWRKPLPTIVNKLDTYIDNNVGPDEKFDIVGHSLGGLVGRLWLQNNKNDPRIGEVVAMGSPQSGAIDAYSMWKNGKITGNDDLATIALNVLMQLQKKNKQNYVETLRTYAPILKDLVPTFNFLRNDDNVFNNNYLKSMNLTASNIFDKYFSVVGVGKSTVEWINSNSSKNKYTYGNGDGTVLIKSAAFSEDEYLSLFSNHGEIVQEGGKNVLERFGYNGNDLVNYDLDLSNKRILFIGSPAYISAVCGSKTYISDESGFLILNNKERCVISVVGTNNGTYHLVVGNVADSDSWRYFEDEIKTGEKNLLFNTKYWQRLIKRDLKEMKKKYGDNKHYRDCLKDVEKGDYQNALLDISEFNKETKEKNISSRIVNNIIDIITK